MEFEVRDNGNGTYSVRETTYDYDDGVIGAGSVAGKAFAIIAYAITIIGLAIGTVSVINAAPFAICIMIALDLSVLSPIVIAPIVSAQNKKKAKEYKEYKHNVKRTDIVRSTSSPFADSPLYDTYKVMFRFILKNAYVLFLLAIATYWLLFLLNIGGLFVNGIMFFCMYGMYYFLYLMYSYAKEFESRSLSVTMIIAIFVALTASCLCAAFLGPLDDKYVMMYPVVLPTVLGLFALVSIPIAKHSYKLHGEGKGIVPLKTIGYIFGGAVLLITIILGFISMGK